MAQLFGPQFSSMLEQLSGLGLPASSVGEQFANANALGQQIRTKNKTLELLGAQAPDLAEAVKNGLMSPTDAFGAYYNQKLAAQKAAQPKWSLQNINGRLLRVDENSGQLQELGNYEKPLEPTAIQRDLQAAGINPGSSEYRKYILDNYRKNGGEDDYANRQAIAEQMGMKPDDPAYRPYVLTGKLPREDQQALTAVDKKAILEADEMVAVNQQAIDALRSAKSLSGDANSGILAGSRAWAGANLPDWMVPDAVSSPESSNATINYDNAVIGQALTQLKAIFGGAPTEGERKILLDLQGSSNLPAKAREQILDRAIAAAERRLQFNQDRANDLRGGEYYKPDRQQSQTPGVGVTKSGVKFSIEGE